MANLYTINALNSIDTPQIDETAFIAPNAQIIGDVQIKYGANIWFGAVLRGDIEAISIGENTNIQDNSVLHTEKETPCIIEDNVTVGHSCILHSCTIKKGSLIGMGSIILNRAIVGENCLIGADSLVTEDIIIPDNTLFLGSPGKIIRTLSLQEINTMHQNTSRYLDIAKKYKENLKEF